ncbi:hypothetical protein [Undibacterium sp. TS12]|uniref:hypothetical protein n=1 Tax=Undibacterium sp. TS12 TaxID=2908202 RepID=UPI001F4C8A61|nr:hypothetical protein [Undibacterium sp. TS12]MCH8618143.1 hypothetical protein [Undibacterium sp. TS12]
MSLIARIEICNYLTEGLNANRRIADWHPLINAVTLRLDSKSALLNLTNGGGKTSMADLSLYLLSRDQRLLGKIRDKCSPKDRGYTHARIEFRDTSDDAYVEPDLLETDPLNVPGQTYVVGVVLYDKADEIPIFYCYSGALEDSPCYEVKDGIVKLVPDARFIEKTRSLRGCQWNKHTNKAHWEDVISLHISTDVLRRNVKYQCEGSDDKNAQFFAFKTRGGETYAEAFFRAVVAPDLLTNILSTWAEEGEQSIEDTLYLSLSQIVKTDSEILKKDNILKKREAQLNDLKPLLVLGQKASEAQETARQTLESIRKDVALAERYGRQASKGVLPGVPKSPDCLVRDPDQDPRVMQVIRGMFLGADGRVLLFADVLAEIANVDTGKMNQAAERKRISPIIASSQVIDFKCDSVNLRAGGRGGGVSRKGYPRDEALQVLELVKNHDSAVTDGLAGALELAFDIAEDQLNTNPASIELRGLDRASYKLKQRISVIKSEAENLEREEKFLRQQVTSRTENQASWKEFQKQASLLPESLRNEPNAAKNWLCDRQEALRQENNSNLVRHTKLAGKWTVYIELLEQAGLEGSAGIHREHFERQKHKSDLLQQEKNLGTKRKTLAQEMQLATKERESLQMKKFEIEQKQSNFDRLHVGYVHFRQVFGAINPSDVDPEKELRTARAACEKLRADLDRVLNEIAEKTALQSAAARFGDLFGTVDPMTYNPIEKERAWRDIQVGAEQSAARLLEKVEALDNFESLYVDQTPNHWLSNADTRRSELFKAIQALDGEIVQIQREIDAINKLSVVDDGHYGMAWEALIRADIPCKRVVDVLLHEEYEPAVKQAAISAMSGLLPAPVFSTHDAMVRAAQYLASLDITIPLIAADELKAALMERITLGHDVYMAGYVAGPYSRQARILLEPAYAQSEKQRLAGALNDCERQVISHKAESSSIHPDSDTYRLAQTARDAVNQNARVRFKNYSDEASEAMRHIETIKPQTTTGALEILKAAKEYLMFGADTALVALKEQSVELTACLQGELEPRLNNAERRAMPENILARANAIDYLKLGGEASHNHLRAMFIEICGKLATALAQWEDLLEQEQELEFALEEMSNQRRRFDEEHGDEKIRLLSLAVEMDGDEESKAFMRGFDEAVKRCTLDENQVRDALQVNFDRAQIYRDNMGVSDAEIEVRCTQIAAKLSQLVTEAQNANGRLEAIDKDERPALARAARAIHELAVELVLLASSMRLANEATHTDFPEINFPVEAHPLYQPLEQVSHKLRSRDFDYALLETVTELKTVLQGINADNTAREYHQARKNLTEALKLFEAAKETYCAKAQDQSAGDATAMNSLEIAEIAQADVTRLQALATLFTNLQHSIERDKEDAEKTKATAIAAHDTGIEALSRLIGNAQNNLTTLEKVMSRYPKGRFFVRADIVPDDRIMEILADLKDHVARQFGSSASGIVSRSDEGNIKTSLKSALIERVFLNPSVEFVNAAIWSGRREALTERLSTGQKVALQFMWIVRQAEFEIERRLLDMGHTKAKKERNAANRMIIIDGIFSSLSNRELIKEAMSGLRDLGGNFQIIGLLHSDTWVNDYQVFPVYLVGRKLHNRSGHRLISFSEEHADGTMAIFSSYASKPASQLAS